MQLTQHFVATTENMRILIFKVLGGGRSLAGDMPTVTAS
jgi:hypothetical protein